MMNRLLVAVSLMVAQWSFAQPDTWKQIDSMNGPGKSVASSCVLNNNGFVIGGFTGTDFTRKMYSYNPNQDDWDDEISVGGETGSGNNRGSAVAFSINNKAYYGLGQGNTANYYRDFWSYDPTTDTWTQEADFAGSARHGAVGFGNNLFGYVGTGQDANGLCKDFFKYDPNANTWQQLNDFPGSARKFAVAHFIGEDAYLTTGDDGVYQNDCWVYVTQFDVWAQRSDLPAMGRSGVASWVVFPSLFIATGESADGTYLNEVWEYNMYSNAWVARAPLPGPARKHATAFAINNKAYVGTGYALGGQFLDDFYSYDRVLSLDEKAQVEVLVYPNPSSDIVQVKGKSVVQVVAIDVSGKHFPMVVNNNSFSVGHLAKGKYVLVLEDDQHQSLISSVEVL